MGSVVVDRERCRQVKKKMYLPDVDEYNSSSEPLTDLTLGEVLSVAPAKSKALKHGYIADLTREGGISPCSLMLGLLYIKRLSQTNPKYLKTVSSRELFLIAMVIASKYMNDEGEMEALTNTEWAEIGCTPKAALDELERNFLEAIDWRLYVPLEEYYSFVTGMEGRVALRQASKRGWLTYTDLAAVWEATDFENSMLAASQQTVKVMCGSTAVYLVCLATLFATSQSLQMAPDTWGSSGTGINLFKSSSPLESDTIVPSGVSMLANRSAGPQLFPPSPCLSEHTTIFGTQSFNGSNSRNGGWIGTKSPHWHMYRGTVDHGTCSFYGNSNVDCQQYFEEVEGNPSHHVLTTLCMNCSNHFRNGCRTTDYHHQGATSVNGPSELYNGTTYLMWKHDGTLNETPFNPSTPSPATYFNPSIPSTAAHFKPSTASSATHFNPSTPPSFLTLPLLI